MGSCTNKHMFAKKEEVTCISLKSQYREKLLTRNLYLHNLSNFCKMEIEELIAEGNKKIAILMMKKLFCIKSKLEEAHELIKIFDQVSDKCLNNSASCEKFDKVICDWLREVKENSIYSNYVKVIRDSEKEQRRLIKSLDEFEFDEDKLDKDITEEIYEHKVKQKSGEPVRYKFNRIKSRFIS